MSDVEAGAIRGVEFDFRAIVAVQLNYPAGNHIWEINPLRGSVSSRLEGGEVWKRGS